MKMWRLPIMSATKFELDPPNMGEVGCTNNEAYGQMDNQIETNIPSLR